MSSQMSDRLCCEKCAECANLESAVMENPGFKVRFPDSFTIEHAHLFDNIKSQVKFVP